MPNPPTGVNTGTVPGKFCAVTVKLVIAIAIKINGNTVLISNPKKFDLEIFVLDNKQHLRLLDKASKKFKIVLFFIIDVI